jgi:hypothetical protein
VIDYRDVGSGPTVLLLHELLMDTSLWETVVDMAEGQRW